MERKPVATRMRCTLKGITEALRGPRHRKVDASARWLGQVVDRWLNYYAVPTSFRFLRRFTEFLKRLWLRSLRRRSQKDRTTWANIAALAATHWPRLEIRHPWPEQRFAVSPTRGRSRKSRIGW